MDIVQNLREFLVSDEGRSLTQNIRWTVESLARTLELSRTPSRIRLLHYHTLFVESETDEAYYVTNEHVKNYELKKYSVRSIEYGEFPTTKSKKR